MNGEYFNKNNLLKIRQFYKILYCGNSIYIFAGCYLLQHQKEGGLADREDDQQRLHRLRHARRHGAEGTLLGSRWYNLLELKLPGMDQSAINKSGAS